MKKLLLRLATAAFLATAGMAAYNRGAAAPELAHWRLPGWALALASTLTLAAGAAWWRFERRDRRAEAAAQPPPPTPAELAAAARLRAESEAARQRQADEDWQLAQQAEALIESLCQRQGIKIERRYASPMAEDWFGKGYGLTGPVELSAADLAAIRQNPVLTPDLTTLADGRVLARGFEIGGSTLHTYARFVVLPV